MCHGDHRTTYVSHVGLEDQTQVVRLGGKYLYLLSILTGLALCGDWKVLIAGSLKERNTLISTAQAFLL